MKKIFISYRRADTSEIADQIYQFLATRLGKKNVFKDIDTIPVGTDFRAVIEKALISCDVMLVLIGSDWLNIRDAQGTRRLDDSADFVRIEIELGLRHENVHIIPVLVDNATMPDADELPPSLYNLAFTNAAQIRSGSPFQEDMQRLADVIAPKRHSNMLMGIIALLTVILIVGGIAYGSGIFSDDQSPTSEQEVTATLTISTTPDEQSIANPAPDTPEPLASTTPDEQNIDSTATNTLVTPTQPITPSLTDPPQTLTETPTLVPASTLGPTATTPPNTTIGAHVQAVYSLSFSADSSILISGSWDKTVRLFNPDTNAVNRVFVHQGTRDFVNAVDISSDGSMIAAALESGSVTIWNVADGTLSATLNGSAGMNGVVFSPDFSILASAGDDGIIRIFDVASGNEILTLQGHVGPIYDLTFSPDGATIVSGGASGEIFIWDTSSGELVSELRDGGADVLSVAYSPDGTLIASTGGFGDNSARIWDATTGGMLYRLTGHNDQVRDVAFSPDGAKLASVSRDKTVRLWSVTSGVAIASYAEDNPLLSVAFSEDGSKFATGQETGQIHVWQLQ